MMACMMTATFSMSFITVMLCSSWYDDDGEDI
jgi:hypothetical protein